MSLDWFPFEPKPFITDTLRLSTEAKGAYLMLILDYYDQERPAPDDDDVLAAITGLSLERWRTLRRVLEPLFNVHDGLWHHNKCASVLADQHARIKKIADASQAGVEARKRKRTIGRTVGKTDGHTNGSTDGSTAGHTDGATVVEANFGVSQPSVQPTVRPVVQPTVQPVVKNTSELTVGTTDGSTDGLTAGSTDGSTHYIIEQDRREGANAPSSASVLSIGSLLHPNFTPESFVIASAIHDDGISAEELSGWLDDWKGRCLNDGTRLDDWHAAWAREYDRRVKIRAKSRPKPRVAVSKPAKKPKPEGIPMPADWQLSPDLIAFAHKYHVDPHVIEDELRNYCKQPAGMYRYSDHDAAFRTFVLRRKSDGQATQRRAPAPGGNSILDAFDRLDSAIASRGGADAEDQPHGQAVVHRLPQE